jgi:hypothetical protein
VFDGTAVRFPNMLPFHGGRRRELHNGHGRTDGKMTGVTNGTAVIVRVPMFVDCGNGLQTDKAREQQRYQERSVQTAACGYSYHAFL